MGNASLTQHNVCIITSVHSAHDVRIFHKQAKSLVNAGYNVCLIAPYDREEIVDGIRIIGLKKSDNRAERMTINLWSAFRKAWAANADIYHFHDPELIPVGIVLRMAGKRVIYDVHEDYPGQLLSKKWLLPALRRSIAWAMKHLETIAAKYFTAIITASAKITDRFKKVNGRTIVIHNYPLFHEPSFFMHENGSNGDISKDITTVISLGGIGSNRCAQEIVDAAGLVPAETAIELIVAGACNSQSLLHTVQNSPGWARTKYYGQLTRGEALKRLKESHIALVLYSPAPNHYEVRSNRLFESMALGLPVITSNFPDWKEIVEGTSCGICVDPLRPDEIADAIMYLVNHPAEAQAMGARGRSAVERKYNWENESIKLIDLYRALSSELDEGRPSTMQQ